MNIYVCHSNRRNSPCYLLGLSALSINIWMFIKLYIFPLWKQSVSIRLEWLSAFMWFTHDSQTHLIGWNINASHESTTGLNYWAYVRAYVHVKCMNPHLYTQLRHRNHRYHLITSVFSPVCSCLIRRDSLFVCNKSTGSHKFFMCSKSYDPEMRAQNFLWFGKYRSNALLYD